MPSTLAEWEEKHRRAQQQVIPEPAPILRELLPLLPNGPALDLACGTGRNALFLAGQRAVTAIDWSRVALETLEIRAQMLRLDVRRASTLDLAGKSAKAGVQIVHADLDNAVLPRNAYTLVLCINYLPRELFREMEESLKPGGMLLFETFTREQLNFAEGPRNSGYLLSSGELRHAFPKLDILFFRELKAGQGISTLLARRSK